MLRAVSSIDPDEVRAHIFSLKLTRLTLGRTSKLIPPLWYKGGSSDGPPPFGFSLCYNISKSFHLSWKACDVLYKMRYILWGAAQRGACYVIKLSAILAAFLDFTKIENRKRRKSKNFFCWTLKMWYTVNILPVFVHILYFFRPKKRINMHFSSKYGFTTCYLWRYIS